MSDDKSRKSRSDAELVQASENHLKYEVDMLAALAEAMPKSCLSDDQVFHYSERKDGIYQEVTIVVYSLHRLKKRLPSLWPVVRGRLRFSRTRQSIDRVRTIFPGAPLCQP